MGAFSVTGGSPYEGHIMLKGGSDPIVVPVEYLLKGKFKEVDDKKKIDITLTATIDRDGEISEQNYLIEDALRNDYRPSFVVPHNANVTFNAVVEEANTSMRYSINTVGDVVATNGSKAYGTDSDLGTSILFTEGDSQFAPALNLNVFANNSKKPEYQGTFSISVTPDENEPASVTQAPGDDEQPVTFHRANPFPSQIPSPVPLLVSPDGQPASVSSLVELAFAIGDHAKLLSRQNQEVANSPFRSDKFRYLWDAHVQASYRHRGIGNSNIKWNFLNFRSQGDHGPVSSALGQDLVAIEGDYFHENRFSVMNGIGGEWRVDGDTNLDFLIEANAGLAVANADYRFTTIRGTMLENSGRGVGPTAELDFKMAAERNSHYFAAEAGGRVWNANVHIDDNVREIINQQYDVAMLYHILGAAGPYLAGTFMREDAELRGADDSLLYTMNPDGLWRIGGRAGISVDLDEQTDHVFSGFRLYGIMNAMSDGSSLQPGIGLRTEWLDRALVVGAEYNFDLLDVDEHGVGPMGNLPRLSFYAGLAFDIWPPSRQGTYKAEWREENEREEAREELIESCPASDRYNCRDADGNYSVVNREGLENYDLVGADCECRDPEPAAPLPPGTQGPPSP